jgi:hypothetical protein
LIILPLTSVLDQIVSEDLVQEWIKEDLKQRLAAARYHELYFFSGPYRPADKLFTLAKFKKK